MFSKRLEDCILFIIFFKFCHYKKNQSFDREFCLKRFTDFAVVVKICCLVNVIMREREKEN